jgi:drug/metabolite transporter (DMT)-like permease
VPLTSLLLVVLAAICHASWNLLLKRAAGAGTAFLFWSSAIAVVAFAPWALWLIAVGGLTWSWPIVACVTASALIHLFYSLTLQRGYREADLSVVYPIARGTGPLLSSLAAFVIFAEDPSPIRLAGLLAVVGAILLIATDGRIGGLLRPEARAGLAWGGATGGLIASYTLVDGYGVKRLGIEPVLLDWFANLLRLMMLYPLVEGDLRSSLGKMKGHWPGAIGIGLLSPAGYILVLGALAKGAPLSVVAPAREMSMMLAALLGMILLREPVGRARIAGCGLMIAGVVLLAQS